MLCLQNIISFHFWNEKMIPFFQRTCEIQPREVVLQGLGQGFLSTATPAILLVGPWDNEISWKLRVVKLSTLNHCKSWCFFHLSSSKKTKTTTISLQIELMQSWCFCFFFLTSGFFEPPHFAPPFVLRGACGDGYLGFRRPLWFGPTGFLLGKWWPIGNCQLSWVFQGFCKGEDWISGLYTNWEHPFWDITSWQQIAYSSF